MDYQDRSSRIRLNKLLPVMVIIFTILIFLLFLVAWIPRAITIILATIMVSVLVITQAIVILKDDGE